MVNNDKKIPNIYLWIPRFSRLQTCTML